jgi:ubiquinone/menaquinone biosynthesis C-methylase UbiE
LSILDAGCGTGRDVRFFKDKGVRATGIDISFYMLIEAKIICPEGRFCVMDMNNLAFNDEMFDGVWACASVIHLPRSHLSETLREFHRVLKKQGILYLSMKQGVTEGYSEDGRFTAYYTDPMLSEALDANGFEMLNTDHNCAQKSTFSRSTPEKWINIWAKK